jgi:DNA mismatch endonuclease (patch repair protein)
MERLLRKQLKGGRFRNVTEERSQIMRAIRGQGNKSTELQFRLGMVRGAIKGWKVRPKSIVGKPDFYFPRHRLAIFLDGCFWHGCPRCGHIPRQNRGFWKTKIALNKARDHLKTTSLESNQIVVQRFWEHEIKMSLNSCIQKLRIVQSKR